MDQNPTSSAASAASPDEQWLIQSDLRAIANRPEHREDQFLDCAPRVQAMAREILRMNGGINEYVRPILMGPVLALERILNALGINTESLQGLEPLEWIRLCAKRIGKDAQKLVDEIAERRKELAGWEALAPDLEALHRELFGKVDPDEPRVTQSAARVLREQREELDKVDDLLNIGEVPRGMRLDRLCTVIADRNGRRRQLVEAHDALDKAGCPLPRFDVVNGARLPERIAAIVKQRDRARRAADAGRIGVHPNLVKELYCDVFARAKGRWSDLATCLLEPRVETTPYREHTPAQLTVDQAHQALTRHGVPKVSTGGKAGVHPLLGLVEMTLVERIDWLAERGASESRRLAATKAFVESAKPGDTVDTHGGVLELAQPGLIESMRKDLDDARKAAAEVDRADGDAPHEPCMGLAAWIRCRAEMHRAEMENCRRKRDAARADVESLQKEKQAAIARAEKAEAELVALRARPFPSTGLGELDVRWQEMVRQLDAARAELAKWPSLIAEALSTKVGGRGIAPEEWAGHVRREHEAHTLTSSRLDAARAEVESLRDEAKNLRTLLFEVLVGMRNYPVARAKGLLAKHGMHVPENTETFESMREQRDNARSEVERLRQAVGMMATAKPSMGMRADDPVGMAQEVVAEVEKLRMHLVACDVIAGSNTPESLARHRAMHPDYMCDTVRRVIAAVEREIDLREQRDAARSQLTEACRDAVEQTIATERLRKDLAEATAKLSAIRRFAHPGIGADGKPKAQAAPPPAPPPPSPPVAASQEDGA